MSWNRLAPIAKSTGRPMCSASVAVNKDGTAKIALIFSASIHEEYGERTLADISAGEGENEGALLIEFDPNGAFEFKSFGKGGGRFFVPVPAGWPDAATGAAACTLGARTADSLVVKLPIEAWRRDIPQRKPAPKPPKGEEPAPPVRNGAVVDMVEYLAAAGVKISRLAEGRFALEGETVTAAAVLKLVNDKRTRAGLDPLPHSKVR